MLIDFDATAPVVYLDTRDGRPPYDVLTWDQRTGRVTAVVIDYSYPSVDPVGDAWKGDPECVECPELIDTHEDRLLVHAANVPDGEPIPTVAEMLERQAMVIFRGDGEVFRRNQ